MSWAYVMCIFLGCWGVHRFYLGRPLTGILYLCTGGLFLVGVIWDLFVGIPAMVVHQGGRDY
jgi:TM2 domain-containing membrane protein YozV